MKRILAIIAFCSLASAVMATEHTKWIFTSNGNYVDVFATEAECRAAQHIQRGVPTVCEETGIDTPVDTTTDIYDV